MKFDIKSFFKNNWQHFAVIGAFILVTIIYFSPAFNGYTLKQSDMQNFAGASSETSDFNLQDQETIHWTNSMFSGMPTNQITADSHGNKTKFLQDIIGFSFPYLVWAFIFSLVSFYILTQTFKIKPIIGAIGSFAFALTSYMIIIIKVGHVTKALAISVIPLVIAGFYQLYRKNWKVGALTSLIAMNFEMMFNHPQITYYLGLILIALGIVELVEAIKNKTWIDFAKKTGIIAVTYVVALLVNFSLMFGTLDFAKNSIRGKSDLTISHKEDTSDKTEGLDRSYITAWSYGKQETFSLLIPDAKGGVSEALGADEELMKEVDKKYISHPNFQIQNNSRYWGDQIYVEGPVYIGSIVVFLFVLGMVFVKDRLKWGVLGVTILGILLSWGSNLPGLTNFFIDNIPFYNKFRAVSMTLIIVEFTFPFLMVLFLKDLWEDKNLIKNKIKAFYITGGVFALFFIALFITPDSFFDFNSARELESFNGIVEQINQIPDQNQKGQIMNDFNGFKAELVNTRLKIFKGDLVRSFMFILAAFGLILLISLRNISSRIYVFVALGALVFVDLFIVDKRYLDNSKEKGSTKKYANWILKDQLKYPFLVEQGDLFILQSEASANPEVANLIKEAESKAVADIEKEDLKPDAKQNFIAHRMFRALNRATHYRVHDLNDGFNSARSSYFHKTIGGYHGAKLKKYQEIWNFYFDPESQYLNNYTGQQVLNMLNTKYFMRSPQRGAPRQAQVNPMALGNAWIVNNIKWVNSPDEEILALGDTINKFDASSTAIVNAKFEGTIGKAGNGSGSISLDSYHPEKLEYTFNSNEDQLVVFSEIFYPSNWKVKIDGEQGEIIPVNYILRGLKVPAGEHKIIMYYEDDKLDSFNTISLAGSSIFWLLFIALIVLIVKEKKQLIPSSTQETEKK